MGIRVEVDRGKARWQVRSELRFVDRGIHYRLLDTGRHGHTEWEQLCGRQYDLIFDDELHSFRPHLLFTFGGFPKDRQRHLRAQRQGVRVVFGLRNENYTAAGFLREMDGVLTPSRFLTEFYRQRLGLESTPLPLLLEPEDVLADDPDPIFFTMINPSREKGQVVLARLAEELSVRRPDIPLLVIESRGSGGQLVRTGLDGGFDLRRHQNIMLSGAVAQPKDIYVPTRALLAPSLCQEAAGRVVAEALVNGIPPLVSDRGGLAETANGAGFVLHIPEEITPATALPVAPEVVEPWVNLIIRLNDDGEFYRQAAARTREAARIYSRQELGPRYVAYFRSFLDAEPRP